MGRGVSLAICFLPLGFPSCSWAYLPASPFSLHPPSSRVYHSAVFFLHPPNGVADLGHALVQAPPRSYFFRRKRMNSITMARIVPAATSMNVPIFEVPNDGE